MPWCAMACHGMLWYAIAKMSKKNIQKHENLYFMFYYARFGEFEWLGMRFGHCEAITFTEK